MQGIIRIATRTVLPALGLLFAFQAGAATLTVTTLDDSIDDDGECSLREALANAGEDSLLHDDCLAGSGDDVIDFDPGLFSGTPPEATIALNSELAVGSGSSGPTDALTIAPPAGSRVILQGSGSDRVLLIGARATPFVLEDAEIHGGRGASGGGVILESGNARFTRVRFADNTATSNGGAIYVSRNSEGVLQIEQCDFDENASDAFGGALYIHSSADYDLAVSDSSFIDNNSEFAGGAVFFRIGALSGPGLPTLNIADSRFEGNFSATAGGALRLDALNVDARLDVSISDALFSGNGSDSTGGAISAVSNAQGSTDNRVVIRRGSFIDNTAVSGFFGGALELLNLGLWVENSLFSGNESTFAGAAILADNSGSGVPRVLHLAGNSFHHSRVSDHTNPQQRTLSLQAPSDATGWSWHFAGNLFAPDPAALSAGDTECGIGGGSGLTLTGGANLSPEITCLFVAGDIQAEPEVALADTGDVLKPKSLLPQPGSPAIDLWPVADCTDIDGSPLTVDLLNEARPQDGDAVGDTDCDSGAFEAPQASLVSVTLDGSGGGTVTSNPAGIDCGTTCSAGFPDGSDVTLTASAAGGSVFAGWSGDCTGTGSCVLTVDSDKNVAATFDTVPSHLLTVAPEGDGNGHVSSTPSGIDCGATCSASFEESSTVTLTATPDANSLLGGWSGGGCSGTGDCTLTLNADTTVSAEFTATHFPITVNRVGSGNGSVTSDPAGIDCPDDCEMFFERTETVTLTATAAAGSIFTGWEGDCATFGIDDCVLDMDNGPYSVDARFELERTLTVNLSGGGSGAVTSDPAGIDCPADCDEIYPHGASVELTATADAGSAFTGWSSSSGVCSGIGTCIVDMSFDRTVTATFQTGSVLLEVAVDGSGTVTSNPAGIDCPGDCEESYLAGTEIELTATPDQGYRLAGWSGDCSGTGACTVAMDQARSVGALFEEDVDGIFADRFESP